MSNVTGLKQAAALQARPARRIGRRPNANPFRKVPVLSQLDLSDNRQRVFGKMLRQQALQSAERSFLITDEGSVSFAAAEALSNRLAQGLQKAGLSAGDRVVLFMNAGIEMVLLALAVNKLSAIWSPVNTEFRGQWLLDTLSACRPRMLICDASTADRVAPLLDKLAIELLLLQGESSAPQLVNALNYADLLQCDELCSDYRDQDYGDTCAILWTSGTTGKSKGVMQSYNNWIRAIVKGASLQYQSVDDDIIYCMLPLYNSAAWITSVFRALIEGIPCVIEKKFSVSSFWERIRHFGATQTFAIGAMGVFLMNAEARADDADNPLRKCSIVPLPPHLWQPFEQRFGVSLLRTGLGMSECLLLTTQIEDRDDVPVYALGFPPDDIELRLCDDEGREVADGEAGEICVRPLKPKVLFNGYFDAPEASAAAFRGEWFLSGDLARRDPRSGAYFFVDRKKDAVRYAGRNISTLEVESVVRRHPAVQDVAAFGIPSAELAEEDELKLNVVLKPGASLSAEQLCEFINDNAPHYFVPRYLEFVDSLPYTPTNKVQKYQLRAAGPGERAWDLKQSSFTVKR